MNTRNKLFIHNLQVPWSVSVLINEWSVLGKYEPQQSLRTDLENFYILMIESYKDLGSLFD